jgi:hypothetical protein
MAVNYTFNEDFAVKSSFGAMPPERQAMRQVHYPPKYNMQRRFFVFNCSEEVAGHVSQIKSFADLMQLAYDIRASETNLTYFIFSLIEGKYEVQCLAGETTERHLFFTRKAWEKIGSLTEKEKASAASITILDS